MAGTAEYLTMAFFVLQVQREREARLAAQSRVHQLEALLGRR